jgi:hypothetical protein
MHGLDLMLFQDVRYHRLLLRFDRDAASAARGEGCPLCEGALHSSDYRRKPRGGPTLPPEHDIRLSFCCAEEGCRKRLTPPSLRFLGRRVYFGAVVALATAMQQGATPVRVRRLRELLGVSPQTLARWREWWKDAFIASDFWKATRVFFSPAANESGCPSSLLCRFIGDDGERLVALLRLLKPLTTPVGYLPDRRL